MPALGRHQARAGDAHFGYVLETGEVVMQGQGKALLAAPEIRKAYLGE